MIALRSPGQEPGVAHGRFLHVVDLHHIDGILIGGDDGRSPDYHHHLRRAFHEE
jgi:hypothetical protein